MSLTISELSKILKLAPSTISKALNGYSEISEETKQRVMEAAKQYGYQPSTAARNLRMKFTDRIGLINPTSTLSYDYFMRIIKGIAIESEKTGYTLVLYTSVLENPEILEKVCLSKEVDGLLVLGNGDIEHSLAPIINSRIPFVLVGRKSNLPNVSYIAPDDENGTQQAIQHLINHGHKKIGFIGQESDPITNNTRFRGFQKIMDAAGLPINNNWIVSASSPPLGGYFAMKQLFSVENPPSAVFCFSDGIAMEALPYLREKGIRVPQDFAIVGCDNISLSQSALPPLTTINIPLEEIGKSSVECLIDLIKKPETTPIKRYLPVNLIIREFKQLNFFISLRNRFRY